MRIFSSPAPPPSAVSAVEGQGRRATAAADGPWLAAAAACCLPPPAADGASQPTAASTDLATGAPVWREGDDDRMSGRREGRGRRNGVVRAKWWPGSALPPAHSSPATRRLAGDHWLDLALPPHLSRAARP